MIEANNIWLIASCASLFADLAFWPSRDKVSNSSRTNQSILELTIRLDSVHMQESDWHVETHEIKDSRKYVRIGILGRKFKSRHNCGRSPLSHLYVCTDTFYIVFWRTSPADRCIYAFLCRAAPTGSTWNAPCRSRNVQRSRKPIFAKGKVHYLCMIHIDIP